jgi:hypothetical protein
VDVPGAAIAAVGCRHAHDEQETGAHDEQETAADDARQDVAAAAYVPKGFDVLHHRKILPHHSWHGQQHPDVTQRPVAVTTYLPVAVTT